MFYTYVDSIIINDKKIIIYVGKGKSKRLKRPHRNKKHKNISKKYDVNREIVFQTENETLALNEEIRLIREHQTFAYDQNACEFACNFTEGGDGWSGRKHTDETKNLCRKGALLQVSEGKNKLVGGLLQIETIAKRLNDGTHIFLSEKHKLKDSETQNRLLKEGLHNFSSELSTSTQLKRVKNGTHPFQGEKGRKLQERLILEGKNKFADGTLKAKWWASKTPQQRTKLIHDTNKRRWARWRKANNRPPRKDDHLYY